MHASHLCWVSCLPAHSALPPHLCLQFDGDLKLPARYLVPPPALNGTSGERARLPSLLA